MGENILYQKAFSFSTKIVKIYKYLSNDKHEYELAGQFLKSGTSIAANIKEGEFAQSRKDFINKNSIALKEANETEYWIELLVETEYIEEKQGEKLISDLKEIISILVNSIKTAQQNNN